MKSPRTVAIIQARMGSTRLPGKVMKLLCGKTLIAHVIDRVKTCALLNDVVIASPMSKINDDIIQEAQRCGVKGYRGSEDDVLGRYYFAAKTYEADIVVRVTADCPLFDPGVLTRMLERFTAETRQGEKIDYLSNVIERSYPRGLDTEIFTFAALERTFQEAHQAYEREHVTPYIYQHPELFTIKNFINESDLSFHRWTLDTEDDWRLISTIYHELYEEGSMFTTADVLKLFEERPELLEINAHTVQKKFV